MKTIVLLSHGDDRRVAGMLAAALRRLLGAKDYEVWRPDDNVTAFGSRLSQIEDALKRALAVLVMVGRSGADAELQNLVKGDIQNRQLQSGRGVGTLLVACDEAPAVPDWLRSWVSIEMATADAVPAAANRALVALGIVPRWSDALALDAAIECIAPGPGAERMIEQLNDVAQCMADGKPLTLMVGPYASVEGAGSAGCPSQVRQALLEQILDEPLRRLLTPIEAAARVGAVPPALWQDHLATLCVLSGRSRDEVARVIDEAIGAADGDKHGAPCEPFDTIGRLAAVLEQCGSRRAVGQPGVTLLTVCPGLRLERALVANGCSFERAVLALDDHAQPVLDHYLYEPTPEHARRAREGRTMSACMPGKQACRPADEVAHTRLVKLFGSRDLDRSIPSDFSQTYELLGQLRQILEGFVDAARDGPYIVLGGGLGTPPIQAAHAVLMRHPLETRDSRPRLAIVPSRSASPDPLRQAESLDGVGRIARLPHSGLDRLTLLQGDPLCFLEALLVAFGGERVAPAAAAAA